MRDHTIVISPSLIVDYEVGQTAQENHDIIDAAAPTDLWFHVTGRPSCHVIAHVPEEVFGLASKARRDALRKISKQGAVLCKRYSKYASEKNLSMDVVRVADVTKTAIPGSVTVTDGSTTLVVI